MSRSMNSPFHSDTATQAFALMLSHDELLKAARLGGLPVPLDDVIPDDLHERAVFFAHARLGVVTALHEMFDRHYPAHYPEDDDSLSGLLGPHATITARFGQVWGAKITW